MSKELKYHIDPWNLQIDNTICATIRAIWREADAAGNSRIKEIATVTFDKAKRMDRKLRTYRKRFDQLPDELKQELATIEED